MLPSSDICPHEVTQWHKHGAVTFLDFPLHDGSQALHSLQVVMAAATAILICAFGSAFQFNLFYSNGFELPFLLFFLFQLAMSSVAILFSTLCKTSSTAVTLGFVLFIVGEIIIT